MKLLFILHIILYGILFIFVNLSFSLNNDGKSTYYILNPDVYNSKVHEKKKSTINSNEISEKKGLTESPTNSNLSDFIDHFFCRDSDLVFVNIFQKNESLNTILKLNNKNAINTINENYLLVIGADKCILESSMKINKSIKVLVRIIPIVQNSIGNTFNDIECNCKLDKNIKSENIINIFYIDCEEEKYIDINGFENAMHEFTDFAAVLPKTENSNYKNSSHNTFQESDISDNSMLKEDLVDKTNKFDFSNLFWAKEKSFFGDSYKVERILDENKNSEINLEVRTFEKKTTKHEPKKEVDCSNKEHQLLLDIMFNITRELIEYLDRK